jgi:hypothetical protein
MLHRSVTGYGNWLAALVILSVVFIPPDVPPATPLETKCRTFLRTPVTHLRNVFAKNL